MDNKVIVRTRGACSGTADTNSKSCLFVVPLDEWEDIKHEFAVEYAEHGTQYLEHDLDSAVHFSEVVDYAPSLEIMDFVNSLNEYNVLLAARLLLATDFGRKTRA
jgi:hypothetical protein